MKVATDPLKDTVAVALTATPAATTAGSDTVAWKLAEPDNIELVFLTVTPMV